MSKVEGVKVYLRRTKSNYSSITFVPAAMPESLFTITIL